MIRALGIADTGAAEAAAAKTREVAARVQGVEAALTALDGLERKGASAAATAALRRRHEDRLDAFSQTADENVAVSPLTEVARLQMRLIDAERMKIAQLYLSGAIGYDARRRIEREFDLEDARNRHALESETGDILADHRFERLGDETETPPASSSSL